MQNDAKQSNTTPPSPDGPDEPDKKIPRRRLLKWTAGITAATGAACAADGFFIEPHAYSVTHHSVPVSGLPAALDGLRIVQITDIHLGSLSSTDEARRIVDMTNELEPEIVVLTGDYASRADSITSALIEILRDLRPKIGAAAVLGNHDYWTNAGAMTEAFTKAGIPMLINEHKIFFRNKQPICIAGADDLMAGRPNAAKALEGVDDDCPRILLCHNPDYAESLPSSPRVDLMICGHTHGGQVKLPFFGPLLLPIKHRKYAEGLVAGPQCPVFISRGLGMVSIPIRFNCRPELPVITLVKE